MNKTPKLRFKEFAESYKRTQFNDCVSVRNGQVDPCIEPYCDMPHIGPGNMEKFTGRLLEVRTAKEDGQMSGKYLFDKEDVLYGKINPHFGKVVFPRYEGLCSADTYPLKASEGMISSYLFYSLQTSRFLKYSISVSMRTGMPKINREELSLYNFNLPSIEEQEKIASFFSLIDDKISLQREKVEMLKSYKTGMMQKVFSRELRFKDDDGREYPEWQKKNLGDVCNIIMGQSPSSSCYNEDEIGLPLIQGNADIKNRKTAPRIYTSEVTKTCDIGDIIMSVRAPVGAISKSLHNACIGRGVCSIKPNQNKEYIYQFLLKSEDEWSKISQGSTFESVNSTDIKGLSILIPHLEEQEKIANFLCDIDLKVEKEQEKLDSLNEYKKGLLQQMFV